MVLRLTDGVVPVSAVELPARLAGPLEVEDDSVLRVPLETGRSVRIDLRS